MNKIEFDLEYIIDEYSHYCFKVVDNLAGRNLTKQDKEEIISDTFYLLWKNQANIKTNLKAYLSTIARNCTYRKLQNVNVPIEYDDTKMFTVENVERVIMIKEKLNTLNGTERELFELYYVCGLKIKEIATLKNKSSSSLKMQLLRLRKKLKEEKDYE